MGKRSRSRRPSGHPARLAARRERDSLGRSGTAGERATPERIARRVCREAAELSGAFEAELWASGLLGALWSRRYGLAPEELDDYDLVLGGPLVDAVACAGAPGARVALRAIERVGDGGLAARAGELARELGHDNAQQPAWLAGVGDGEIERTAVMREDAFDDGFTVFIEASHRDGERHAVGVYIDNNLAVMAKDILLADSVERVEQIMRENPDPHGELKIEPIESGVAAGHVYAAMELTDMTLGAPLGEDYARLRALALLRADELPDRRDAGATAWSG